MDINSKWIRIALSNLLVVGVLGVLMRYKIGFEFPYLDQKNIQHAHSHFAFTGWVSLLLMVLMVRTLNLSTMDKLSGKFRTLFRLILVSAYGMLVSFIAQGYGFVSLLFSTGSIILSFIFAFYFFRALRSANQSESKKWFVSALIFNIISSAGPAVLAYMMSVHHFEQHIYLASEYWYLHFQYNGWFFFSLGGIFVHHLETKAIDVQPAKALFLGFFISCVPTYGLSVLWAGLPVWLFIPVAMAAALQLISWFVFLNKTIKRKYWKLYLPDATGRKIFLFVIIAFSIKILLQLGSVVPSISHLAFGFRPIVIAYLHLVLLAFTSVLLIGILQMSGLIAFQGKSRIGLWIFLSGVFLNQLVLAVQGISSFSYTVVPFVNEILFMVALILFTGLLLLQFSGFSKLKNQKSA